MLRQLPQQGIADPLSEHAEKTAHQGHNLIILRVSSDDAAREVAARMMTPVVVVH